MEISPQQVQLSIEISNLINLNSSFILDQQIMLEKEASGFAESLGRTTATVVHVNDSEVQEAIDGMVIAKGDAREVGHTISDSSQYLACIMFINLFSASIKV